MPVSLVDGWFNALDHVYGYQDECWPGVTTCLKVGGLADARWYTPEACRRGTLVHKATEALDGRGSDDPRAERYTPFRGYIDAWASFCAAARPVWSEIEGLRWNRALRVGGRLDRVGTIYDSPRSVVDIKTGGRCAWHDAQVEGYRDLDPSLDAGYLVYLWPTGQYRVYRVDSPVARAQFRLAVRRTWGIWNADQGEVTV